MQVLTLLSFVSYFIFALADPVHFGHGHHHRHHHHGHRHGHSHRQPPFNVNSPQIGADWLTCSWQAVTWDGSGYPEVHEVEVIIYGGCDVQMNLGKFSNGGGYAQIFVPSFVPSGWYRARVFGFKKPHRCGDCPVFDQSTWFHITNNGCPGGVGAGLISDSCSSSSSDCGRCHRGHHHHHGHRHHRHGDSSSSTSSTSSSSPSSSSSTSSSTSSTSSNVRPDPPAVISSSSTSSTSSSTSSRSSPSSSSSTSSSTSSWSSSSSDSWGQLFGPESSSWSSDSSDWHHHKEAMAVN